MRYFYSKVPVFVFNRRVPEGEIFTAGDDVAVGNTWNEVNPDGSPITAIENLPLVKPRRSKANDVVEQAEATEEVTV